jgi:5-methylcytosine-specific restriction endonuclease McrA
MNIFNSLSSQKNSAASLSPVAPSNSHSSPVPCELPGHTLEEGLPADAVHARALAARKHLAKAQRALSFWLVEIEERRLYRYFGCSSVFHYGELYLELASHTIAEYLRSGKEMARLPMLAEACEKGDISPSKIREISRVAVPETEKAWLDLARSSTYRQIERLVPLTPKGGLPPVAACAEQLKNSGVSIAVGGVPPDGPAPGSFPHDGDLGIKENAHAHVKEESDDECVGAVRYRSKIVLELENDRLAIIERALEKARQETGERDRGALLEHMARVFLDHQVAKAGNVVPYRVTVHHLPERGAAWVEGSAGPLHVEQNFLEEALCDAEVLDLGESPPRCGRESWNTPRHDEKLSQGATAGEHERDCGQQEEEARDPARERDDLICHGPRLRRTIPAALRRQVLERDGHQCTAPGCGHRHYLSLHHLEPVAAGGRNRAGNLTTVCGRCHRALHWGRLSLEGEAPGELVWKDRNGRLLKR